MKSTLILMIAVAALAGCQQSSSSGGTATQSKVSSDLSVATPAVKQTPAKFEVLDFKLDEQKESYGTKINGRGTLIAKDDTLKKGSYMVWLSSKMSQKNDERMKQLVLMRDGIGTIETFDFLNSEDSERKKVKYFDWEVIGFVKLQEGIIAVDKRVDTK